MAIRARGEYDDKNRNTRNDKYNSRRRTRG